MSEICLQTPDIVVARHAERDCPVGLPSMIKLCWLSHKSKVTKSRILPSILRGFGFRAIQPTNRDLAFKTFEGRSMMRLATRPDVPQPGRDPGSAGRRPSPVSAPLGDAFGPHAQSAIVLLPFSRRWPRTRNREPSREKFHLPISDDRYPLPGTSLPKLPRDVRSDRRPQTADRRPERAKGA